jgi:DNA-binding CsgD family transcriptional regulator
LSRVKTGGSCTGLTDGGRLLAIYSVGKCQCVRVSGIAAIRRSADTQAGAAGVAWDGGMMTTRVAASDRGLHALAAIVTEDRPDVPAGDGLPPSLLADLMSQIRCDVIAFGGFDSGRQETWSTQFMPDGGEAVAAGSDPVQWQHYWHCQPCSYPDRTGDLHSILRISDFYSARQWHSIGTRCGINRPMGFNHNLMLTLPAPSGPAAGPGRTMRLFFFREHGPDFSERDRALLTLLRPHLHQAYHDAERRRHPLPRLTPRQKELLCLVAAGHTNAQIARRLAISEGTVRTHLETVYERLHVSSRTAAVTRAFPGSDSP